MTGVRQTIVAVFTQELQSTEVQFDRTQHVLHCSTIYVNTTQYTSS